MYRAKVKSSDPVISKRWAYGGKATVGGKTFIIPDDATIEDVDGEWMLRGFVEVIPASVGQSTGKRDYNGRVIYAADTLKSCTTKRILTVAWADSKCAFVLRGDRHENLMAEWDLENFEVTDKPELLQETDR